MKSKDEIIQENVLIQQKLTTLDNAELYHYLNETVSISQMTAYAQYATNAEVLAALQRCFTVEKWALEQEQSLKTSILIEQQASLLLKLQDTVLSEPEKMTFEQYQSDVALHIETCSADILNEVGNWREKHNNLTTSAKCDRPNATAAILRDQDREAKRLSNLLNNQHGDCNIHIAMLLSLEEAGNKIAKQTLHTYYKDLGYKYFNNATNGEEKSEAILKELSVTRIEAQYYLACYYANKGKSFFAFRYAKEISKGIEILEKIKFAYPAAMSALGTYHFNGVGMKSDERLGLHHYYLAAKEKNEHSISQLLAVQKNKDYTKAICTLAGLYLGLLEPLEGDCVEFYGIAHLKSAFDNSPTDFIEQAWGLSSHEDLSGAQQLGLIQIVEAKSNLPKQMAEALISIKEYLYNASVESMQCKAMMKASKIVTPKNLAQFALVLIDDRDIQLAVRQGWLLLAENSLAKQAPVDQKGLQSIREFTAKISRENRVKLSAQLGLVISPAAPQESASPSVVPSFNAVVSNVHALSRDILFSVSSDLDRLKNISPPATLPEAEQVVSYPKIEEAAPPSYAASI